MDEIFGHIFMRLDVHPNLTSSHNGLPVLTLIDVRGDSTSVGKYSQVDLVNHAVVTNWSTYNLTSLQTQRNRKFPFVCGDASDNWGLFLGQSANFTNSSRVVVTYAVGALFESDWGLLVGDNVCSALSLLLPRLPPSDVRGMPLDHLVKQRGGQPPACGKPTFLPL